ncbi:zinc finger protein, partial [Elysia marginata]
MVKKSIVPRVPLEKVPLVDTPFKRVAMDIVGPINPPSEAGHRFILTFIDYATRYAEAVPLRKIDTETVAEALVDIYSRLGVPEEVVSGQGTQFMSDCMKEVCRLLGIKQKATTPYHPMCNGLVERFNATFKTCLRRLCSEQPRQWHRYINPLLFAYREVPQESTHFAPFELLYGRTVRGPMHILRELWIKDIEEPEVKTSYEYVLNLRERLDDTLKIAREEREKAQGRQKHYYDRTAKCRKFSVGEKVLVLLPTDSNKLLMQWKGPFEVVATVGVSDYRINMGGKVKTFHANLLKGYIARDQDIHQAAVDEGPPTSSSAISAASLTVIEDEHFNDSDCETLPELGIWGSNETVNDLQYGDQLTPDQRRQLEEIASSYSSIFSDRPGTVSNEEHRIEL